MNQINLQRVPEIRVVLKSVFGEPIHQLFTVRAQKCSPWRKGPWRVAAPTR